MHQISFGTRLTLCLRLSIAILPPGPGWPSGMLNACQSLTRANLPTTRQQQETGQHARTEPCALLMLLEALISFMVQLESTFSHITHQESLWKAIDGLLMTPFNHGDDRPGIADWLAARVQHDIVAYQEHLGLSGPSEAAAAAAAHAHHAAVSDYNSIGGPLTIAATKLFSQVITHYDRLPACSRYFMQGKILVNDVVSCVQLTRAEDSWHQIEVCTEYREAVLQNQHTLAIARLVHDSRIIPTFI